jgi:hypothetical protein
MMRLMPWGFNLMERKPMAEHRYKDIIRNLRDLYVIHATTRLRVDDTAMRTHYDAAEVQSKLDFDLTQSVSKVVRRSVTEDPRVFATIYENDIFVIADPTAFFKQFEDELEGAYQHGLENGKRFAERHGWKRVPSDGTD